MKTGLTLLVVLISFSVSSAQKKIPPFGEIAIADLKMTSCSFEPDAPAMKLFDVLETDFDLLSYGDSKMKIEHRVRIKIFNNKGYDFANVRIPYINKRGMGKIKELKGIIYSLDGTGKIIKEELGKDDFFKQKVIEYMGVVTFTFPNLQPGCIVEYSYTRIESNIYQLDPWIIQGEIPVQYSFFKITTPSNSFLKEKLFGMDTIDSKAEPVKGERPVTKFYYKENIPSFDPEPFMSSKRDNLMKMVFLHLPSYSPNGANRSPLALWFERCMDFTSSPRIRRQMIQHIPGTEKIIDSAKKINSVTEQIRYLYKAVQKQIPTITGQTYMPNDIIEAWNNHAGNTADVNLILINFLEKVKIPCFPLLVSTRENGLISKDFPTFSQMNGMDVVAMKDSVTFYLLDASIKFQSIDNPPVNILNREALLLGSLFSDWVLVSDERPLLKQHITLFCELKESGLIEGQASLQHYNYAKSYMLDSTLRDEEKNNKKSFDKKPDGLTILSVRQEIPEDDNEPLNENISFTYQPQQTENFYFLNPQFLTPQKANPFTSETRKTDIDLICNQQVILSINLAIPESFEVDHVPKNIIVRAPDSSFYYRRSFSVTTDNIQFTQIFETKKSIFSREDYEGVKEFFSRMYALMNEDIIIKRKK